MFLIKHFTSLVPFLIILTLASHLFGQQTGRVDIEQLGMSFENSRRLGRPVYGGWLHDG